MTAEHLFAENKERLIHSAMTALISRDFSADVRDAPDAVEQVMPDDFI